MVGHTLFRSTLTAIVWISTIFAAPMAAEESNSMEENTTSSCFKATLPEHLQMHYDMCMGNNLSGDNMMKENDILSCILKTVGVITDEETMDISKLKMMPAMEEEASDMKVMEDVSPFNMAVEKCEENKEIEMSEDFVECLFETLSMNCTSSMAMNEEPAPEDTEDEN